MFAQHHADHRFWYSHGYPRASPCWTRSQVVARIHVSIVSKFPQALSILTTASSPRNCTGPVSNLVDFVPLLQRLPNSLTNRAKKLHEDLVDTYGGMISEIEKRMNSGQDVPRCLVKTLVETGGQEALDHLDKVMICSAFLIGGVESVRGHYLLKIKVPEMFPEYISIPDRLYRAMVFCDHAVASRYSRKSPC
jgi:hypothetical protein